MRNGSLRPDTSALEAFLAWESRQPCRHEYVAGEVHAMTGASVRHNLLTLNLVALLRPPARAQRCIVVASDVALLAASDRVYYPDVMLLCGDAARVERLVEAPMLVAEITSPSTRATDLREKLAVYRSLASLRAYLIIDQRRRHVIVHVRAQADAPWERHECTALDDALPLDALALPITVGELYEGVDLPPLTVRDEFAAWADEDDAAREGDEYRGLI